MSRFRTPPDPVVEAAQTAKLRRAVLTALTDAQRPKK